LSDNPLPVEEAAKRAEALAHDMQSVHQASVICRRRMGAGLAVVVTVQRVLFRYAACAL
jgi:hypothetical protein